MNTTTLKPTDLATPGLTPFHLTPDQVRFFDDQGFLILKNWITGDLLARLQTAGEHWIQQGLESHQTDSPHPDYCFANRAGKSVMFRVDYVHDKHEPASLELLGSPQVLAVAESLCGPNFVPTYESMVFKQEGDGEAIRWHQDACHPRDYRIFNYDLYLDHSRSGAGALWVVPGSQRIKQDVCQVADAYGWEVPGSIEVEMEPGDVLLHDVMVLHGSPRAQGNALRRTIYYEFRAAEQILSEGPWDLEWIDRRLRLIPLALEAHQAQYPEASQFAWKVREDLEPKSRLSSEDELKVAHIFHTSGSFCSASSGS